MPITYLLRATIAYVLTIDRANLGFATVDIHLRNAPSAFHLAMKVHAEYNAGYWRNIDSVWVESNDSARPTINRVDTTLTEEPELAPPDMTAKSGVTQSSAGTPKLSMKTTAPPASGGVMTTVAGPPTMTSSWGAWVRGSR